MKRWNWRVGARCRAADAEELFVVGAAQREAMLFCRPCPVRTECLAHALDHRIAIGVWGGMTERQRRALLRARPEVRSWSVLLTHARTAYYAAEAAAPEPTAREPTAPEPTAPLSAPRAEARVKPRVAARAATSTEVPVALAAHPS